MAVNVVGAFDPKDTWDDVCEAYVRCGLPVANWWQLAPAYQAAWKIFIAKLELRVSRDVAMFKDAADRKAYESGWNKDQLRRQLMEEVRRQTVDTSPEIQYLQNELAKELAGRQRAEGQLGAEVRAHRVTHRELDSALVQLEQQRVELSKLRMAGRPYRPTMGYQRIGPPVRHVHFIDPTIVFRNVGSDGQEATFSFETTEQREAVHAALTAADDYTVPFPPEARKRAKRR